MTLDAIVNAAADEVFAAVIALMPQAGPDLVAWCRALSGDATPDAYFLHPRAFPAVRLPWWAEESLGFSGDLGLQKAVAVSTVAGYYFIRLLDDAMDERSERALRLLPTAAFLHHAFEAPYRTRFASEHAFWVLFRRVWSESAEASALDAAPGGVTWERFCEVSARKVCAGVIPVAAVFHLRAGTGAPDAWMAFVRQLARVHQLDNDVSDWARDLARGGSTYFLSEGRRRGATAEDMGLWVADEGYVWADGLLRQWSVELRDLAQGLGSAGLTGWLADRERALAARGDQARAGLAAVARLARVAGPRAWAPSQGPPTGGRD